MKNIICGILMALLSITAQAFAPVNEYVSVDGKKLMCNGQPFYAVGVNYDIDILINGSGQEYISPYAWYGATLDYEVCGPVNAFNAVLADFQLLKSQGFNTVRLIMTKVNPIFSSYNNYSSCPWWTENSNALSSPYTNIFALLEQALQAAEMADLKVILLSNGQAPAVPLYTTFYLDYLEALAYHFKDNSTLIGYDFLNEPCNESENFSKEERCNLVKSWSAAIHSNSPYHLTTIGYCSPTETNEWDPAILDIDFATFHPYDDDRNEGDDIQTSINRINSEIYWMGQTMKIPWMIGETSISASPDINYTTDQGTPEDQRNFAEQTLAATRNCGGCGYLWWEMYDETDTRLGYRGIIGHDLLSKPVVSAFSNFDPWAVEPCEQPPNHYNTYGYSNCCYSGQVVDQNNNPIENAVVTCSGASGRHLITYTNSAGFFTLCSVDWKNSVTIACPGGEVRKLIGPMCNGTFPGTIQLERFLPSSQLNLNNFTVPSFMPVAFEATDYITATNVIVPGDGSTGASCTMEAENVITLNTGFHAQEGCSFRAWIGPITPDCEDTQNYRVAPEEQTETQQPTTNFKVYPNPTANQIIVEKFTDTIVTVDVINIFGEVVVEKNAFEGTSTSIDLSGQAEGIYFVRITEGTKTEIFRVVKMN